MKRLLKHISARTVGRWVSGDASARAITLCYHSIHPTKGFSSTDPQTFDRHLDWLKRNCDVVPFRHIWEAAHRTGASRPAVAITFDDGYADNFEFAFPLLAKHGLTATFFLTTGLIDKDRAVIDRFRMLRRSSEADVKPLEWSEIREMARNGMEFGAHTYSHPNLAELYGNALQHELTESKQVLEQRLGREVDLMAYPFGKPGEFYTAGTVEAVRAAAYRYAASVLFRNVRTSDSALEIPRFFITRDSVETVCEKVRGWWDLVAWWQERGVHGGLAAEAGRGRLAGQSRA
jgi:peptidoglycan/xylan/chitin deacetylase (PgdA/CDA1 family)